MVSSEDFEGIDGLLRLHDQVSAISHRRQQIQEQRDSLNQQLRGWKSDLSDVQSMLVSRTESLESWQDEWDAATTSLQTSSPTPDEVLPILDAIKDLTNIKKERDDMLHRMESIKNETIVFLRSVQAAVGEYRG